MKKKLLFSIKIAVSLGFIGLLVWFARKDIPQILVALKSINPVFFLAALLLNIVSFIVIAERFRKILLVQGIKLKLREAVYLTFVGNFFNNFFPTTVGGDLVKAYYATKKTSKKLESFSAVFFDRFFGFLSIGLLAFIGIIVLNKRIQDPKLLWGAVIFSLMVLLAFILFMSKRVTKALFSWLLDIPLFKEGSKLRKLYNSLNAYKKHRMVVGQVVGISLIAQAIAATVIYFLVRGLSQDILLLNLFLIIPLVATAAMMPSINGLGVREGAFVYFLKEFITKEAAFAVSILYLAIVLIMGLIGGILHLFSGKLYRIPLKGEIKL